ncbi:MAG: hypothetical protein JOZ31_10400 [Verrucomicrobia bacterium]|nr:hypothetical protein [Verrucomicrobiota bacterium]
MQNLDRFFWKSIEKCKTWIDFFGNRSRNAKPGSIFLEIDSEMQNLDRFFRKPIPETQGHEESEIADTFRSKSPACIPKLTLIETALTKASAFLKRIKTSAEQLTLAQRWRFVLRAAS